MLMRITLPNGHTLHGMPVMHVVVVPVAVTGRMFLSSTQRA